MSDFNVEKAKLTVKKKLEQKKKQSFRSKLYKISGAAAVLLLLSIPFIVDRSQNKSNQPEVKVEHAIIPGSDGAVLTLEDGSNITLGNEQEYESNYAKSNGEQIIYTDNVQENNDAAKYNSLTIPRGAQFFVKLSDGTSVWLNSESKLRYPVTFVEGQAREVELLYGEAYFEVTPSAEHGGSKFKVNSRVQNLEVLGTKFNIKSYRDEETIVTTLVEGKVAVGNVENTILLAPNQQSLMSINSTEIATVSNINVSEIIAWKNGIFSFKEMPLHNIMKVLSRWYDADVLFADPELGQIKFTGVLGKEQSIEEILSIITNSNKITYEIKDKTIIFK